MCPFYLSKKGCLWGDGCRYSHVKDVEPIPWSDPNEADMNPVAVRSSLLLALSEAVVVPWDALAIALSMHVLTMPPL